MREATDADRLILLSIPLAARFAKNEFLVAFHEGSLAAYLAWRPLAPGESEILDIQTERAFRRCGLARALLQYLKKQASGNLFLEVRESNAAARKLYGLEGFAEVGLRRRYYSDPPEDGIVMKFHSC